MVWLDDGLGLFPQFRHGGWGATVEPGDLRGGIVEVARLIQQLGIESFEVVVRAAADGGEDGNDTHGHRFEQRDRQSFVIAQEENRIPGGESLPVGVSVEAAEEAHVRESRAGFANLGKIGSFAQAFDLAIEVPGLELCKQGRQAVQPFLFDLDSSSNADCEGPAWRPWAGSRGGRNGVGNGVMDQGDARCWQLWQGLVREMKQRLRNAQQTVEKLPVAGQELGQAGPIGMQDSDAALARNEVCPEVEAPEIMGDDEAVGLAGDLAGDSGSCLGDGMESPEAEGLSGRLVEGRPVEESREGGTGAEGGISLEMAFEDGLDAAEGGEEGEEVVEVDWEEIGRGLAHARADYGRGGVEKSCPKMLRQGWEAV